MEFDASTSMASHYPQASQLDNFGAKFDNIRLNYAVLHFKDFFYHLNFKLYAYTYNSLS